MLYLGRARIVKEKDVRNHCLQEGIEYEKHSVFVDLLREKQELLYCRYGMSLPYTKIKEQDLLVLKPINEFDHFLFIGILSANSLEYKEPLVKGEHFKNWIEEFRKEHNQLVKDVKAIKDALVNSSTTPYDGGTAYKASIAGLLGNTNPKEYLEEYDSNSIRYFIDE